MGQGSMYQESEQCACAFFATSGQFVDEALGESYISY